MLARARSRGLQTCSSDLYRVESCSAGSVTLAARSQEQKRALNVDLFSHEDVCRLEFASGLKRLRVSAVKNALPHKGF
jgi:hypothetical protein